MSLNDDFDLNGIEQMEIFFEDLTPEAQGRVLAFYRILGPVEANLDIVPLAVLTYNPDIDDDQE
jgi:hypothetical protein